MEEKLNQRDKLFWGSVGVISILSIYLVSTFFVSQEYDYSGFSEFEQKGHFSLMIPPYLLQDDSLSNKADLAFSDYSNEVFFMVVEEKKKDLKRKNIKPSLMEYFSFLYEDLEATIENASLEDFKDQTIHNMHVISCEVNGSYSNVEVYYILSACDSKRSFYQLRGWTSMTAKPHIKKDLFATMQSFKTLDK
jgi:hypothetical protein